ncbi:hypothetical protein JCM10213_005489 [Rhodosporidiobolus nylandii]
MFASTSSLFTAAVALFAVASSVSADKVFNGDKGVQLIDYQPPFTAPKGGEVWIAGGTYEAAWNTQLPSGINQSDVASTADLVLGYTEEGSSSLNLYWTVAQDVPLYTGDGSVSFTLPQDLETRDSYLLVLLGSTHNTSPEFTVIANPAGSALSDSSSSDPSDSATNTPEARSGSGLLGLGGLRKVRRSVPIGKARLA